MSYLALYRRLRPKTFAEVIGQEHITKTLKSQINNGRVSHAYLFCGTHGTGKTSTAQVFSLAMNCENPNNAEPCGICPVCEAILEQRSMNVVEIDAASNNGVDNIRDIREEVKYPPTNGRYKVYIIDEVHMLSAGAFNALLKTLEEPPEHVVFILATTDSHKIPATILSRCQRYDFKRFSHECMFNTIKGYLASESVKISDDALSYIVSISDGAMRDALSVLDQCMSFYTGSHISLDMVLEMVGASDNSSYFKITDSLARHDSIACLDLIDKAYNDGKDINRFVIDLIGHLRDLLIILCADNIRSSYQSVLLNASKEYCDRISEQSKLLTIENLTEYINSFSDLLSKLRYTANERAMLEITCIKLCRPYVANENMQNLAYNSTLESFDKRLTDIERRVVNGIGFVALNNSTNISNNSSAQSGMIEKAENETNAENDKKPEIAKNESSDEFESKNEQNKVSETQIENVVKQSDNLTDIIDKWEEFTNGLSGFIKSTLRTATPFSLENDTLVIAIKDESSLKIINEYKTKITDAVKQRFGNINNISFTIQNERSKNSSDRSSENFLDKVFEDFKSKVNFEITII